MNVLGYKSLGASQVVMGHAGHRSLLNCSFQILFQLKDLEKVEISHRQQPRPNLGLLSLIRVTRPIFRILIKTSQLPSSQLWSTALLQDSSRHLDDNKVAPSPLTCLLSIEGLHEYSPNLWYNLTMQNQVINRFWIHQEFELIQRDKSQIEYF